MEAASIPETPTGAPPRNSAAGLASATTSSGCCSGWRWSTSSPRTPSRRSTTSRPGLSNGTIWALIALGYTLVYGIIELINFAHGEVFMIGSFVSVSIWATLGVTDSSGVARLDPGDPRRPRDRDARERHAQHDDRARRLPAAAQRAEARPADHGDRHELHPAERRPAVAPDAGRGARPHRLAEGLLLDLRRRDRALGRLRGDRHGAAARRARLVRRQRPATARRCARPRRTRTPRG